MRMERESRSGRRCDCIQRTCRHIPQSPICEIWIYFGDSVLRARPMLHKLFVQMMNICITFPFSEAHSIFIAAISGQFMVRHTLNIYTKIPAAQVMKSTMKTGNKNVRRWSLSDMRKLSLCSI